MHTKKLVVDGQEYTVHFNNDWSGDARVGWKVGTSYKEAHIPGALLPVLGAMARRKGEEQAPSGKFLDAFHEDFEEMRTAFLQGAVALVECTDALTGEMIATICTITMDGEEAVMLPVARMFEGDAFEQVLPPADRVVPSKLESVIKLESTEEELASHDLRAMITRARESKDPEIILFLRRLWDDESWEFICQKIDVQGSTWYVWWMDGVRAFMRKTQDSKDGQDKG